MASTMAERTRAQAGTAHAHAKLADNERGMHNFKTELETLASQLAVASFDRDQFKQRAETLHADLAATSQVGSQLEETLRGLREEHLVGGQVRGELTRHNRELAGEVHR
jgi:chromosome segregation ATPase